MLYTEGLKHCIFTFHMGGVGLDVLGASRFRGLGTKAESRSGAGVWGKKTQSAY